MKNALTFLLFIFIAPAFSAPALADQVIGVSDGDTLTVLRGGRPLRIRLANIDAPEIKGGQSFGARSKESLSNMCYGRDATYSVLNTDAYGRAVALVTCEGVDVNRAQVALGLAWIYTRYNNDKSLIAIQAHAQAERRGLWSEQDPTPPWQFRHKGGW